MTHDLKGRLQRIIDADKAKVELKKAEPEKFVQFFREWQEASKHIDSVLSEVEAVYLLEDRKVEAKEESGDYVLLAYVEKHPYQLRFRQEFRNLRVAVDFDTPRKSNTRHFSPTDLTGETIGNLVEAFLAAVYNV